MLVHALLHDRGIELSDLLGHLVFELVLDVELPIKFLKGIFRFGVGTLSSQLAVRILQARILRSRVPVLFGRVGGLRLTLGVFDSGALLDRDIGRHIRESDVRLCTLLVDCGCRRRRIFLVPLSNLALGVLLSFLCDVGEQLLLKVFMLVRLSIKSARHSRGLIGCGKTRIRRQN